MPNHKHESNLHCENCFHPGPFLINGYFFGDRILEDVMFEVSIDKQGKAYYTGYDKSPYTEGLNMEHWIKRCSEYLENADILECSRCNHDVYLPWDESSPRPEGVVGKAVSLKEFIKGE